MLSHQNSERVRLYRVLLVVILIVLVNNELPVERSRYLQTIHSNFALTATVYIQLKRPPDIQALLTTSKRPIESINVRYVQLKTMYGFFIQFF